MPSLTYSATFGHQVKTVRIYEVKGGQGWHVLIDNYYQGDVQRVGGELVFHPTQLCQLQGDDVAAMLEVMEGESK
jgi:hypothetical protein